MILLNTDTVWTWNHFAFGVTYGLTVSFIFLFAVLFFFKPRIKVGPFLCKPDPLSHTYMFKFVNTSYFSAHDVKIELHKFKRIPMGGGTYNVVNKKLTLLNGEIPHMPRKLTIFEKADSSNPHCLTVSSTEDINNILSDPTSGIVLRIGLKHGLTGLSKVFEQEYANEEDIKTGKFKPGSRFVTL